MSDRPKLIPAAHLILEKNGKYFLMKRHNTGYQDGYFGVPAGHKEHGETFLECAVREAYEEAGIKVNPHDVTFVHVIHKYVNANKNHLEDRLEIFFLTKKWRGEPKIVEPHKCSEAAWFPKNKLPKNMVDYVGECLKLINKKKSFYEKKIKI